MERLTVTKKRILGVLAEAAPSRMIAIDIGRRADIRSGSLYPALRTLRSDGLVETHWEYPEEGSNDSPRRLYGLSVDGEALAAAIREGRIIGANWRSIVPASRHA